ncbi:hypothetical protein E2562_032395 [Oryza meyeriana var. granulata]|uniref:Uncharacterized protein n=1 Tax=Oryza meyeriana var. granulata TaxID=110450 RepID=A0A6G1CVK2_9ORYZ|nr:hypothetical protein E2562_032395 [Oryza meyeriana var. granulata]
MDSGWIQRLGLDQEYVHRSTRHTQRGFTVGPSRQAQRIPSGASLSVARGWAWPSLGTARRGVSARRGRADVGGGGPWHNGEEGERRRHGSEVPVPRTARPGDGRWIGEGD